MPTPHRDRRRRVAALSAALLILLAGCSSTAVETSPTGTPSTVLGMRAILNAPYTTFEGSPVGLDVYLPEDGGTPRGAVLLLHGGAFVSGDRSTGGMQRIAQHLVGEGYVTASMSYTLAPTATYPTQVDQTLQAVQFLRDHAAEWNIDPDRIALFGSSAGGTIALQAAVKPREDTYVAAIVSLSGASVLDASAMKLGAPRGDEVKAALAYLGCTDIASCTVGTEASPALTATAESSPALIVNGVGELIPEQQAEAMAAALQAVGVEAQLAIVPIPKHAADLLSPDVWGDIDDFLSKHLDDASG